ncbi:hypothetical protein JCM8097_005033 [Rhodosporidiobolus ruineniae]
MQPVASTSAALSASHIYTANPGTSRRPSNRAIETAHTFFQPDVSTETGTAEAGLRLETKHAGIAAGRRVFVGPTFDGQGGRGRQRGGSISTPTGGGGAAPGKGKGRARAESAGSVGEGGGFLPWRRRRGSASTSRKPTGETVPSASTSRNASATAGQQSWTGSSFEIGGDVREAARRRDERLKREREQREEDERRREEERRRTVSAPAGGPPPRSPVLTLGGAASFVTARDDLPLPSPADPARRPSLPSRPQQSASLAPPSLYVDAASTGFVSAPSSPGIPSPSSPFPPTPMSDGLLGPPLKGILRGKDQPLANGSGLGHGHPSAGPYAPSLLAIPGSSRLNPSLSAPSPSDRPPLSPRSTSVRFPAELETPVKPSGAQPPAPPSVVLARSDDEADAAPASFPPAPPRPKERPEDVLKTARMLVKLDWSARDDLPDEYDEHSARKFPTTGGEAWEELGVVWRRGGWIELWGEFKFNVPAHLFGRKKLKAVIPLRPKSTHVSLYSSTDLVFCLTHHPQSHGVISRSASTSAAPTATPLQRDLATADDEKDDSRRARHAKASKRGYVHLRSNGTNIFLFRARTHSASKQWMWELYLALGGTVPRVVEISVPGLGAKVRVPVPQIEREDGDGETWAPLRPRKLTEQCVEQLSAVGEWKELVEDAKRQGADFRLAWRRGSVLDWIREDDPQTRDWAVIGGGVAFRQGEVGRGGAGLEPVLELRPATHYPTTCRVPVKEAASATRLSTTVRISEPPGVEGFLVRHRPNGVSERVYLSSRMGLLFLCRPSTAHPPEPPMSTQEALNNPAAVVLAPFVFGMASLAAPSKRKQGQILRRVSERGGVRRTSMSLKQEKRRDWTLKSMDAARKADGGGDGGEWCSAGRGDGEDLSEKSGDAFLAWLEEEEKRRAFLQITDARGFVNLSEVESVEPELSDEHDAKEMWVKVEDLGGDEGLSAAEDRARLKKMRSFVVKTRSGVTVRFECHSIEVREEWVDRLRALATYWRRRERVDAVQLMELSPASGLVNRLPPPPRSDRRYAFDGAPEDDDGEPPPTRNEILSSPHLAHLYNWCILDGCRALMKQGVMHVKKDMRGTFRLRHVLLLPGTLIEYQSISRDMHGQPLPTPYHRRRLVVSLRDCYVYSGSLAAAYLSTSTAARWDPGDESEHQFPRCYPATDGLRTADEAEDCTFIVVRMRGGGNGKNKRLGQKGRTVRIYRTRSKLERDAFVWSINAAIEHVYAGEQDREERLRDFPWLDKQHA